MIIHFVRKLKISLLLILFGFFAFSCGLKYTPVKTLNDKELERKQLVIDQLQTDFKNQNLKYKSYGFAKSSILKPPSFYVLDSLYSIKYKLEQENIIDKSLNEKIAIQRNITYSDTNAFYYIENHIFAIEKDSANTVFNAEIFVDRKNKINTIEILESVNIDKSLVDFYKIYKFNESFIYLNTEADEAELAFYDLYKQKLESLNGNEKEEFLTFMLSVMKIANRNSSLDKSKLIKEYVRIYTQGQIKNFIEEKFEIMEEFYDDKNNLIYYFISYQFSLRNNQNILELKKVEVYLDPFLQLIEVKNLAN